MCFFQIFSTCRRKRKPNNYEVPFLNPYYCSKCRRSFADKISYDIHLNNH